MAEKKELNSAEKIALAKELYSRGSRNYLVKDYSESADDLSKASELYAEVYGNYGDELGMTYMLYAKALIALAQQGENKLLTVPEEEEDAAEDSDEVAEVEQNVVEKENSETNNTETTDAAEKNGEKSHENEPASSSTDETENGMKDIELNGDGNDDDDDTSPTENLQIAWEALEMAVQIFTRQGEPALANLADAYFELAEISLENSNFETAISDFKKSLDIRMKLPTNDLRIIAEIHYKIGLNFLMLESYEESVVSLKEANRALDCEIESQKEKEPQAEHVEKIIKEIEELKQEIANKVQEIEEAKEQSMEDVKKELSKLISTDTFPTETPGQSSSNEDKPKPNDISNLIKRKKPDVNTSMENDPPVKRPAM